MISARTFLNEDALSFTVDLNWNNIVLFLACLELAVDEGLIEVKYQRLSTPHMLRLWSEQAITICSSSYPTQLLNEPRLT